MVRTPRCAVLINQDSLHWAAAISGVIRHASEIWGGRYFLIIPTDGESIKDKFWEILEAYNPDYIAVYNLTFYEMKELNPTAYNRELEQSRKQWDEQGFSGDFIDWFEQSAKSTPVDELSISRELESQLIDRLSPFHFDGLAVRQLLTRDMGFAFPFTKIADIAPFRNSKITEIFIPKPVEDRHASLLVHSQTGIASPEYCSQLESIGFSIEHLPDQYDPIEFIMHVLGDRSSIPYIDSDRWRPDEDYMPKTPFGISMLHLGGYYRIDTHRTESEPLTVVVGDAVEDFCLYYSLSRMHEHVFWLPLSWLRSAHKAIRANHARYENDEDPVEFDLAQKSVQAMVSMYLRLVKHGHSGRRIRLLSTSLSTRQLVAYRRQMADCSYSPSKVLSSITDCVPIEQSSTQCVVRVFEENNYTNHQSAVFIDGTSVSPFVTPKPKNFREIKPSGHHWLTSLEVDKYMPPSLPSLGKQIINIHDLTTESRVASDGVVYHCPNIAYFGGDIDVVLVRPKITLPDEMELLGAYFAGIGATIRYSDKGNYFVDTVRRFGGLDELGRFIRAASTRGILERYMTKARTEDGGVIYLSNDQRAYQNFDALKAGLPNDSLAADLVDSLVAREVLQRGYILHCERCRLSSWYGLNVLTSNFVCNRCAFEQQFTRSHWKNPIEPRWYYKLSETVYQFYENNSHLTVQALYALKSRSKSAFHYVPEIELVDFPVVGEKRELDVACLIDGKIVLGECKTETLRPKDAAKFETLLHKSNRHPDKIVFATNLGLESISEVFKSRVRSLPSVEVLTFNDMYDTTN